MYEINYLDDALTLTLRTEREVAFTDSNNFFTLVRRAYAEIPGLTALRYEEGDYPDEEDNSGFILTLSTADREWKEFHKYESETQIRLIDGEFGHSVWPRDEFNLIGSVRNLFIRLHAASEIISFGSGDVSP